MQNVQEHCVISQGWEEKKALHSEMKQNFSSFEPLITKKGK